MDQEFIKKIAHDHIYIYDWPGEPTKPAQCICGVVCSSNIFFGLHLVEETMKALDEEEDWGIRLDGAVSIVWWGESYKLSGKDAKERVLDFYNSQVDAAGQAFSLSVYHRTRRKSDWIEKEVDVSN